VPVLDDAAVLDPVQVERLELDGLAVALQVLKLAGDMACFREV
jgi:hypothetical protein